MTNGKEDYTRARQDIYLAGYENQDAESLVVTGAIESAEASESVEGSIWAWAEMSPHYLQGQQFALVSEGSGLSGDALSSTLSAFRNARDDTASTNAYDTFLRGIPGDGNKVIWGAIVAGSRRVILRKAESEEYTSLEGAVFTLYKSDKATVVADSSGNPCENLTSNKSGIFYVGTLEYGTYYLKETTAPAGYEDNANKFFELVVSEDGVTNPVVASAA